MSKNLGRPASLREIALDIEMRADKQPTWKKGALVFERFPARDALPKLNQTPSPPTKTK